MAKAIRCYGFMVQEDRWADSDSFTVKVMVREGDKESPINPRSEGEDSIWDAPKAQDGLALSGLTIRAYASTYRDSGVHLRPAEFEGVHYVDARLAKRMLTTFKRIDRAIERAPGGADEVGDYVEAVARAIGATFYVRRVSEGVCRTYSDHEWAWLDIAALKREVRNQWRKLEASHRAQFPEWRNPQAEGERDSMGNLTGNGVL